jgi:hypothetical protein
MFLVTRTTLVDADPELLNLWYRAIDILEDLAGTRRPAIGLTRAPWPP